MSLWSKIFKWKKNRSSPAQVKAIVFDFDGTLADSMAFAVAKVNSMASEYGYAPISDVQMIRHKSLERVIREDLKLALYQLPGFIKRVKETVAEYEIDTIKVFEGIKDIIEELGGRFVLGIVTSNFPDVVERILTNAGVKGFSFVHSDTSLFGKHVVFKRMFKERRLSPDEVLYVGDEVRDIHACKKAGIKMVAVSWGFNTREALQKEQPFNVIDQPDELLKVV